MAEVTPQKRRYNARVVQETAASSRPKRAATAAAVRDVKKPTSANGLSGSKKTQETRGRKAGTNISKSTPSTGVVKKGRVGRPPKAKTIKAVASGITNGVTKEVEEKGEEDGDADEEDRSYWLMKAEPETRMEKGVDVRFSIDDLRKASEPEPWDGVRNAAARNNMRSMRKGDLAFFYHSNCKVPGIAGVMEIVQEHSVDESAFDPGHPYYDPKSKRDAPKWEVVHVEFRTKFKDLIKLTDLKSFGKPGGLLDNLQVLKQSRLSVSAVTGKQWKFIRGLAEDE